MAASIVWLPYRSNISNNRSWARWAAAINALESPSSRSGYRELRRMIRYASSFNSPRSIILMGGTKVPSWKISVLAGPMLPGREPPRSQK